MGNIPRTIKINNLIDQANASGRGCPAQVIFGNDRGLMIARADLRGYLVIEVQRGGLAQFPGVTIGQWDMGTDQWVRRDGAAAKLLAWVPEAQKALGLVKVEKPALAYNGAPGDGGLTPEDFDGPLPAETQRQIDRRQILPPQGETGSIEDELGYEVPPRQESNAQRILREARETNERGQAALDYALKHQGDLGRGNAAARMNRLDF